MYKICCGRKGFTLVELSIVLVILGLLAGGVLSGQALIHAAELRSISTQYTQFATSINSFKDKYFALPGDMTNATAFWGAADGSTGLTAACTTTSGTGTQTCNGNGDGIVNWGTQGAEWFRIWQHLANAGLIEGHYTGITTYPLYPEYGSTSANAPAGKIGNSLWYAGMYGLGSAFGTFSHSNASLTYATVFMFAGVTPNDNPSNPVLKPEDAWNIDLKMDDGSPATGKVTIKGPSNGVAGCTDTADSNNMAAKYLVTSTTVSCALIFMGGPFPL